MKPRDWTGQKLPITAKAENLGLGLGVKIHITASSEFEAARKVEKKLQCHQDFLKATGGNYVLKFAREIPGLEAF